VVLGRGIVRAFGRGLGVHGWVCGEW
jgi:hypothetical protein